MTELETLEDIPEPKQDEAHNDEPECIGGNERDGHEWTQEAQHCKNSRNPKNTFCRWWQSHVNFSFHKFVYELIITRDS